MLSLPLLLLALALRPIPQLQEPQTDSLEANILRRFDALPPEEQQRIASELWHAELQSQHPLCLAARNLLEDVRLKNAPKRSKTELPVFSASRFAPALNLKTKKLTSQSSRWQRFFRKHFAADQPNRYAFWSWDYAQDSFATPTEVSPRQSLLAFLSGQWPESGKLSAYVEGSLDTNREMGALAAYFQHAYRDRSGRVYQEIRLYDLWNSQTEFGISDVEAIAFLREIVGNAKIQAPIPTSLHHSIYQKIKESFEEYRSYYQLRHVLAQRMLNPAGSVSRLYADIIDDLDAAWVLTEHRPSRMASFLALHPTRSDFLDAVAQRTPMEGPPREEEPWNSQQRARDTLPGVLRQTALEFLADEGLLGFHRR